MGVVSHGSSLLNPSDLTAVAADAIELRVDLIGMEAPWREAVHKLRGLGKPVILTIRDAAEGGKWSGPAGEREEILLEMLPQVAAIDVEARSPSFETLARATERAACRLIGSYHDFDATPPLETLLAAASQVPRDAVFKVASRIHQPSDLATLKNLLASRKELLTCALGMGTTGLSSRVELARAGSCLVYGFADKPNAPGQPSCAELSYAIVREGIMTIMERPL